MESIKFIQMKKESFTQNYKMTLMKIGNYGYVEARKIQNMITKS